MLTTKSLGSINELLVMEKLLADVAAHFAALSRDKKVVQMLDDAVAKSEENQQVYLKVLEGAK